MKNKLYSCLILFLLIVNINIVECQPTGGLTCFTDQEILNIMNKIDSLSQTVELDSQIIVKQKQQIQYLEAIRFQDSLINAQYLNQLDIYKDQNRLLQITIDEVKPKWYDNKTIWFGMGVFLTIFAIKVE